MLVLNGFALAVNLALKPLVMFRFVVWLSFEVILKHREIIRYDEIVLGICPGFGRHIGQANTGLDGGQRQNNRRGFKSSGRRVVYQR